MRYQLLSLSCAFFGAILLRTAHASCYYPDGSFPSDYVYVPCSGDDSTSTSCCILSEGDQCLSNGLCYYPGGKYMFRGGCSDKSWNSPNCFQHCKNTTNSYSDSYERIVECGGDRYCCYSDGSTCCNDDSKVFKLGPTTIIKDLNTKTTGLPIATPTGILHSATGLKSTSIIGSATPSTTFVSSSSAATATPDSNKHTFSRRAVIISSVAGIAAFTVILGLLWFFIRRHYRNKLATGGKEQGFPLTSDGFQKLPDKSPRPVEVPAPLHSPAPPYQPPAYQNAPYNHAPNGAVEIDNSYLPPQRNQWGQPVFEAPAQPYRHV